MIRPFRHALEAVQADWDACAANDNAPEDARPSIARLLAGAAMLLGVVLTVMFIRIGASA